MTATRARLFNGATDEDARAFEDARAGGEAATLGDDTPVVAVWRRPRGLARWSERIAECGGPDPLRANAWDKTNSCDARFASSAMCFMNALVMAAVSPFVLLGCACSRAKEIDDRFVLTEKRAYRIEKERGKMVWKRADLASFSDARRVEPYCFCCGGFDGFAVRVQESEKFNNHVIPAAGQFTKPQEPEKFREIQKEHPAEIIFRLSTTSPSEAIELVDKAMRAVKPEVMTKE